MNRGIIRAGIVASLIMCVIFLGCTDTYGVPQVALTIDDLNLTDEEKLYLEEHKTIVFAVEKSYSPIEYLDKQGIPRGLGVSYLKIASEVLGIDFVLKEGQARRNWHENLELMRARQIDMLPTASYTKERQDAMVFTTVYYSESMAVIGHKGVDVVLSTDDLDGKRLCFVRGHWQSEYMKNQLGHPDIIEVSNVMEALDAVNREEAEYTLIDNNVFTYCLQAEQFDNVYPVGTIDLHSEHRMAFTPEHETLRNIMNKLIVLVPKEDIFRSAFFRDVPPKNSQLLFQVSVGSAVIIGMLLIAFVMHYLANARYRNRMLESRSALIENLSHDLKTPLATLKANISLLKSGIVPNEEKNDYYIKIEKNIENLNGIIEDLYNLSSDFEQHEQEAFREIDVYNYLFEIYKFHEVHFREHGKYLTFDPDTNAMHNKVRLRYRAMSRAIENLLSNALKFSPARGSVIMQYRIEDKILKISVTDHGPGIPLKDRHLIFGRFYQSRQNELSPGKGLGLSITKSIVAAHKGRIYVDSKPFLETKFTIELPLTHFK